MVTLNLKALNMRHSIFILLLACLYQVSYSQKIVYSEPDRSDARNPEFEIIGKVGGHFMVYKNSKGKRTIVGFDLEMNEAFKVEQKQLPNIDRMINIDFFNYSDFVYLIYQYQKKNVVYCMFSKLDATGKPLGDPITLDTTHIGFSANNKIYTAITSEDKSRIGIFKINSKHKTLYTMTTLLYNDKLTLEKRNVIEIPMEERNEYLSDFQLDNEGNFVFCKFSRNLQDNISKAAIGIKRVDESFIKWDTLAIDKLFLDDIYIKLDNNNNRYLLASFYYKEKRGSVDGYVFSIYDKLKNSFGTTAISPFTDELRKDAKGDAGNRFAFDDYFIRNIVVRKDGGFIISAESYYTTSRFNNWNRWDMFSSSPWGLNNAISNYYYSPYYSRYWWLNSPRNNSNNQLVRHHADNIMVLSFSPEGLQEWYNVITKSQDDDNSDDLLSFQVMNTGGSLHFLFNQPEKRLSLLTDYTLAPTGEINRNPTLKNLDKGYEFMPKFGKQVSGRQMIIPCLYRNSYLCFAKIDYN
jgi:hypothetical protein